MHNLVVNRQLTAVIIDDKHTHAATAIIKRVTETVVQPRLIKHRQALLDITRLSHGDDTAIITNVEDTVLLKDGTEHVLHNDRRGGVRDERRLLMELLGEEIDTQVAVLARLGRGRDADDLARAALEDDQIANADVVAGDGDGVGEVGTLGGVAFSVARHFGLDDVFGTFAAFDDYFFVAVVVLVAVMMVVVMRAADGVEDAVGGALETVTE